MTSPMSTIPPWVQYKDDHAPETEQTEAIALPETLGIEVEVKGKRVVVVPGPKAIALAELMGQPINELIATALVQFITQKTKNL